MRVFTAVFYLLFFTLTAWGQTRRVEDQKAAKSHVCVTNLSQQWENAGVHFKFGTVVASSLNVSLK